MPLPDVSSLPEQQERKESQQHGKDTHHHPIGPPGQQVAGSRGQHDNQHFRADQQQVKAAEELKKHQAAWLDQTHCKEARPGVEVQCVEAGLIAGITLPSTPQAPGTTSKTGGAENRLIDKKPGDFTCKIIKLHSNDANCIEILQYDAFISQPDCSAGHRRKMWVPKDFHWFCSCKFAVFLEFCGLT